jgi:hypothetical protein
MHHELNELLIQHFHQLLVHRLNRLDLLLGLLLRRPALCSGEASGWFLAKDLRS